MNVGWIWLGLAAIDPGVGGAGVGEPATVAAAVAQYNHRFAAQPGLVVSTAAPADFYSADDGTVPAWLDGLGLTGPELRAVAAAVGAYAHPADPPEERRKPSLAEAVAYTGLSILADNNRRRYGYRDMTISDRTPFPASPPPPPKEVVPGNLVAMGTCGGAFFSALTRLNQSQPRAPFTGFVRMVGATVFAGPLRADPTCAAATD